MFNENKEVIDIKYDEEKNKRINLFDNIKSFLSLNKNNHKKVGIITRVILVVIAIIILLLIIIYEYIMFIIYWNSFIF